MAKVGTTSVDYCESCEWRDRLLLKMSLAVDTLSHELDSTTAKYGGPGHEFAQILEGRRLQQLAIIRAFDELLDEEEFNTDDGSNFH